MCLPFRGSLKPDVAVESSVIAYCAKLNNTSYWTALQGSLKQTPLKRLGKGVVERRNYGKENRDLCDTHVSSYKAIIDSVM